MVSLLAWYLSLSLSSRNEPPWQRCQIKKIKSARSDVKICQNPPFSIGQIRQKSARNLELFVPFFTPWGSVLWVFIADLA
jgi:hypothetical protein